MHFNQVFTTSETTNPFFSNIMITSVKVDKQSCDEKKSTL